MKFNIHEYQLNLGDQNLGSNIKYVCETESTNDDIWFHMNSKNPLIIITDHQTLGRGRRKNAWFSEQYKSLIFSIGICNSHMNLLSQKVSLSIAKAIINETELQAKVKWPNDILINNKKIAGILIESKKNIMNIGVGINVNNKYDDFPEELKDKMTSLYNEGKEKIQREKLLALIMKSMDYYFNLDDEVIINQWNEVCAHNNSAIIFHNDSSIIKGTFIGLDTSGHAIIKSNGQLNYYPSGIIEL